MLVQMQNMEFHDNIIWTRGLQVKDFFGFNHYYEVAYTLAYRDSAYWDLAYRALA